MDKIIVSFKPVGVIQVKMDGFSPITAMKEIEAVNLRADALEAEKADSADVNTSLALKADKSTTYTKTETNTSLALKADKAEIEAARGTEPTLGARLDATDAQLAEIDQRIDEIITTPVPVGEIIAEEIIDARQGKASVGANITEVKTDLAVTKKSKEFGDLVDASNIENILKVNWQPIEKSYEKTIIELVPADVLPFVAFASIEFVGSEIWVMYRRATDHLSGDGRIDVAKSSDDGITWTITTLLEEAGVDYRDPNLIKAPNGNIVLRYFKTIAGGNPVNSVWFKVYDIVAGTWGTEIASPLPPDFTGSVACRGNGAIVDGKILFANYLNIEDEKVYVVESADNGASWTFKSYIEGEILNETSLAYLNGKVYAVLRSGVYIDNTYKDYRNRIYISVSNDKGLTWSHPKPMPVWGHAPSLEVYNGRMIMTYRSLNSWDNKDGKSEVNLVMLRDTGVDSPIVNLIWSTGGLDLGYCDVRVSGSHAYIVYHLYTTPSRKIFFYKVPTTFLNGLNILNKKDMVNPANYISNDVIYKNYVGTVSTKSNVKIIMGDVYVTGGGTNKKAFSITLDKTYTIHNVIFTVRSSTGMFIVNLDSTTSTTINAVLTVISGTFGTGTSIQVSWQALVT